MALPVQLTILELIPTLMDNMAAALTIMHSHSMISMETESLAIPCLSSTMISMNRIRNKISKILRMLSQSSSYFCTLLTSLFSDLLAHTSGSSSEDGLIDS